MKFEWDPKKARSNLRKHKVSFEEAATAITGPMAATGVDPDHSIGECRYITFDDLVKSLLKRHPGESRGPEHLEITGFRLSPE
jgi:hypothetical protein